MHFPLVHTYTDSLQWTNQASPAQSPECTWVETPVFVGCVLILPQLRPMTLTSACTHKLSFIGLKTEQWVMVVLHSWNSRSGEGKWNIELLWCFLWLPSEKQQQKNTTFVSEQIHIVTFSTCHPCTCTDGLMNLVNSWILPLYLLIGSEKGLIFMCTYIKYIYIYNVPPRLLWFPSVNYYDHSTSMFFFFFFRWYSLLLKRLNLLL